MSRKLIIKTNERTSSITVYAADLILLENDQKKGETRADAHRRIFSRYFTPEEVKKAQDEIQKKVDRQALLQSDTADQLTLVNENDRPTYKDRLWSQSDYLEIIVEKKRLKDDRRGSALSKALGMLHRAKNRKQVEIIDGKIKEIDNWLDQSPTEQLMAMVKAVNE